MRGDEPEMASQKAARNKDSTVTTSQVQDVIRWSWAPGKKAIGNEREMGEEEEDEEEEEEEEEEDY